MSEVQKHGFIFEDWIKSVLGVRGLAYNYTQKWDIPNLTPISVKCMGMNNALEFGSAVRVWEIDEEFIVVVGRWRQEGSLKIIISIDEIKITLEVLRKMKGLISLEEIMELDKNVKKFPAGKEGQESGIAYAKKWKSERRGRMGLLTITHKIDSKNQRRIQCNLNYKNYIKLFGLPSNKNIFRGNEFNSIIDHGPRKFQEK